MNEIEFVGWWNKDINNPIIKTSVPDKSEDWELVVLTIERVADDNEVIKNKANKLKRTSKKLDRSVRNLLKSTKHWSKI